MQSDLRAAKAALASLLAAAGPTREELRDGIARLEGEREALRARLAALKREGAAAGKALVTGEECREARRKAGVWEGVARKRRRIVGEMWGMIEESVEGLDLGELKVCAFFWLRCESTLIC
jgi:hypothetical protein